MPGQVLTQTTQQMLEEHTQAKLTPKELIYIIQQQITLLMTYMLTVEEALPFLLTTLLQHQALQKQLERTNAVQVSSIIRQEDQLVEHEILDANLLAAERAEAESSFDFRPTMLADEEMTEEEQELADAEEAHYAKQHLIEDADLQPAPSAPRPSDIAASEEIVPTYGEALAAGASPLNAAPQPATAPEADSPPSYEEITEERPSVFAHPRPGVQMFQQSSRAKEEEDLPPSYDEAIKTTPTQSA